MNRFDVMAAVVVVAMTAWASSAPAADGDTYILTIAVGDGPLLRLPGSRPLPQAEAAAVRLRNALTKDVPETNWFSYTLAVSRPEADFKPTVANIRRMLETIRAKATTDDRVYILFVGHGFENTDQGAALIAGDSELGKPGSFLSVRELLARVKRIGCKEVCVFVDACRDFHDDVAVAEEKVADDLDDKDRKKKMLVAPATYIVQSCSLGQHAHEDTEAKRGGLMTESLAQALTTSGADADGDGNVTVREAVTFARKRVRAEARLQHREPQDLAEESSGDAFLLAKVEKKPAAGSGVASGNPGSPAGTGPDAPPALKRTLPYNSETLGFGPQYSPSLPPVGRTVGSTNGTAPAFLEARPVLNAVANGIPQSSPAGQVLSQLRQPTMNLPAMRQAGIPPIPNFLPAQARQHIPAPGQSLGQYVNRLIR